MGWGKVVIWISVLIVFIILAIYWFAPTNVEFIMGNVNSNFSLNAGSLQSLQYYPNMRFPSSDISYKIDSECSSGKASYMEKAFAELSQSTNLIFFPVDSNQEILVTCSNQIRNEGNGLFVAGEGGPTKVIAEDKFNVILTGEILLLSQSSCNTPIVPLHELLHVLGFQHSANPNNIMYNITNPNCMQTLGEDIPVLLNQIYSYPSLPDLEFGNTSASMHGRYLDINMTIMNEGLADAQPSSVEIYADGNLIKEFTFDGIKLGEGEIITLYNVFVMQINVKQLEMVINYNLDELDKNNNEIKLTVK